MTPQMMPQATSGTTPHADTKTAPHETATTTAKTKKRRTVEERLQDALVKQQVLQAKIDGLKTELNENSRKTRNRGLMLVGIVIEQAFKNDEFADKGLKQLFEWTHFLPEKDREAYITFLHSLHTPKQS